jgi:F-type H+-transporting ATPase subunit epsilon
MNDFSLHLYSAASVEHIDGVTSFVGEDESGQFGMMAHHARMATVLTYGLARFCVGPSDWRYLAVPGAVLYFIDNALHVSARRFVLGPDFHEVSRALDEQLLAEEQGLAEVKLNLRTLEQAMFQRLWRMEGT